jgi:tetratricopeptide (TPR) repeat protein
VDAIGENLRVYDEWERLAFRAPYHRHSPEARARWQALYDGLTVGDRHLTMPLRTVEMVLLFGWSLAMADGRYADAVELMQKYYAHPEAPTSYTTDNMEFGWSLAVALLHLGNEDEALAIYTDMVHCDDRSVSRLTMSTVRWHLQTYCDLQPPDGTPSQAVVEWGYGLLEWFRGPRFAKRNFPAVVTYNVLWKVLDDIGVWLRRDDPNGSGNSPAPCSDGVMNS